MTEKKKKAKAEEKYGQKLGIYNLVLKHKPKNTLLILRRKNDSVSWIKAQGNNAVIIGNYFMAGLMPLI